MSGPATSLSPAKIETSLPVDPDQVARIKTEIDLKDRAALVSFGERAQRSIGEYADTILRDTMNKDSGEVGDLLGSLLVKVKGLDPSDLKNAGFFGRLFGNMRARVERYKQRFQSVAAQVDRVALELEKAQDRLKRDIAMLDGLYERNFDHLRQLEAYIRAGAEYLEDATKRVVPELEARVKAAGDGPEAQMMAQELRDLTQSLERLDKRVHDLRLSRTIAMQTMPQVRLIQNGNASLADKLQSSIHTTIPAWKNQMTIALALHRQKEAIVLQREVSNTTNELLKKNAEALRTGSVEIEKESQRGIVDIETLTKVNSELIGTINDILQVQADGKRKRAEAENEMKRIETELKTALLTAIDGKPAQGQRGMQ